MGVGLKSEEAREVVRFGAFEACLETGELRKHGIRIRLEDKPFQILACLLERPNALVRREELRARLWGDGVFVDFEAGLNAAVRKLRAALGDSAGTPRFIETLPRRGYRFVASVERGPGSSPSGAARLTLAALPLRATGDDAEPLADGLTEELTSALAQIPGARVVSRTSSFYYKDRPYDVREAGRALGATHLLEGAVRQIGSRLRLNVALTAAATGYVVWAETYDREASDLFALEQELARAVAASLDRTLWPRLRSGADDAVDDPVAQRLFHEGKRHWNRWTPDGWRRARTCFEQAVERRPGFARAVAWLARSDAALGGFGLEPPASAFRSARAAAERALSLDPDLADAHGALAECLALYEWDWDAAEASFRRAIELDPADAVSRDAFAACCLLPRGRISEARARLGDALQVDPLSPRVHAYRGLTEYLAEDFPAAEQAFRRALELEPGYPFAAQWLSVLRLEPLAFAVDDPTGAAFAAYVLARRGDRVAARSAMECIESVGRTGYLTRFHACLARAGLEQWDEAGADLRAMIEVRDPHLPLALMLPCLAPLRAAAGVRFDDSRLAY